MYILLFRSFSLSLSRSFSFPAFFSFFSVLFYIFLFRLLSCSFSSLREPTSFSPTKSSFFAGCFAHYCVRACKPFCTRSCWICGRLVYKRCDTDSKAVAMAVSRLSRRKSHYLACSRAYWNVEPPNHSSSRGKLVPGQGATSATTLKELPLPSTLPLEKLSSSAPLRLKEMRRPLFSPQQ